VRNKFLLSFFLLSIFFSGNAQTDTTLSTGNTVNTVDLEQLKEDQMTMTEKVPKSFLGRNPYKGFVAPTVLLGLGVVFINNPVYDRKDFKTDLHNVFHNFNGTRVDDYLIYSPYVVLVGLNLAKIPCKNDFINTSLIIVKAEIVNLALTFALKNITRSERPNGQDKLSWPSGHTSQAFLAAAIVNREFKYKSPWIGVGAYGLASTVGVFRMLNNKHWLSDVVAGAGIGILSANVTYLTHKWRWGRPGSCFMPTLINGKPGAVFAYRF
jgi:membrane-associated phospholipid phosphatase